MYEHGRSVSPSAGQPGPSYADHMTASAGAVAAALRERLPNIPAVKLQKLLYYCQGHHLAHFGEPLFSDRSPTSFGWPARNRSPCRRR